MYGLLGRGRYLQLNPELRRIVLSVFDHVSLMKVDS